MSLVVAALVVVDLLLLSQDHPEDDPSREVDDWARVSFRGAWSEERPKMMIARARDRHEWTDQTRLFVTSVGQLLRVTICAYLEKVVSVLLQY